MARFEAKEVHDENRVSLGWFVYDGDIVWQGPHKSEAAAKDEAKILNDQLEEEIKKKVVAPPERSSSRGR